MPVWREMTVAHVREPERAGHVDVLFLESARFYRLPKTDPSFDTMLAVLQESSRQQRRVKVRLASDDSDVIEAVDVSP